MGVIFHGNLSVSGKGKLDSAKVQNMASQGVFSADFGYISDGNAREVNSFQGIFRCKLSASMGGPNYEVILFAGTPPDCCTLSEGSGQRIYCFQCALCSGCLFRDGEGNVNPVQ